MKKELLGVIGGLGPLATAHFLELVTAMTEAPREQDHLDMIIYNFPSIPDRTGYILGSNLKSPLPGLLAAGSALSRQGVARIAIPCITAHYFHEALEQSLPVPVLNGVTLTAGELRRAGVTRAGILATDGTVYSGLFSSALEQLGIQPVLPESQKQVMELIYDDIKAGRPADMETFAALCGELRDRGAQAIILGCTELSLIKRDNPLGPGFLDAMEVLAKYSILSCGGRLRPAFRNLMTEKEARI